MSNSDSSSARSPLSFSLCARAARVPLIRFLNFPLQSVSHPVQHHCLAPLLKFPAHTFPLVLTKPSLSSDEVIFFAAFVHIPTFAIGSVVQEERGRGGVEELR